jgi:hypothetical protein
VPALVAVAVGILLGYATGGSLAQLAHFKLRWEWLLLPLFVIQAVARGRLLGLIGASDWSLVVWTLSSVALVVTLLGNWTIPGMALAAAGVLMNLDVVLLNRGMPFAAGGADRLALVASAGEIARSTGGFYRAAAQGDLLALLGDVMPISWGRALLLISPGDVVLMVAVAVVLIDGMKTRDAAGTPPLVG